MKSPRWLCVCALACLAGSMTVGARGTPPFTSFYAFGDSLVDNGNDFILTQRVGQNPAVPPSISPHRAYDDGRFSNGPVAFEYLWQLVSGAAPDSRESVMPWLQD